MATKEQCKKALSKKGGTLVVSDVGNWWNAELEAPQGHNWSDTHCRIVSWMAGGPKSEFWDCVMEEIRDLDDLIKCDSHSWCAGDFGICEWWGEQE